MGVGVQEILETSKSCLFWAHPFLPELVSEIFIIYCINITEDSVRKLTSGGGQSTSGQINLVKNLKLEKKKKTKKTWDQSGMENR